MLLLEWVEVAMGLFVFTGVLTLPIRALMVVPMFLVVLAIWYLALRPRWQAFKKGKVAVVYGADGSIGGAVT